ncbi:MAG TPA: hypothetical protein VHJ58_11170 [Vicinamibacterales bacterium]|jgi:hypothetical protein|nr:hypothetical protein [Vicinamibacterales bacterium]
MPVVTVLGVCSQDCCSRETFRLICGARFRLDRIERLYLSRFPPIMDPLLLGHGKHTVGAVSFE